MNLLIKLPRARTVYTLLQVLLLLSNNILLEALHFNMHCLENFEKRSSGRGVVQELSQKTRLVRHRQTRHALIPKPFRVAAAGRVSSPDNRLLNNFMRVKVKYFDGNDYDMGHEEYQATHPFGQVPQALPDIDRWDPPQPHRKPELILDNHKHKYEHGYPYKPNLQSSPSHSEHSGELPTYNEQWGSTMNQHKPQNSHIRPQRPTLDSGLSEQWPSTGTSQSQWPSQHTQSQSETWPSHNIQSQSQWPSLDFSQSEQWPSKNPTQSSLSWQSSHKNPSTSKWPPTKTTTNSKPSQIYSKPFKVTTPLSHMSNGGSSQIESDTILSRPVMVFDSLTGEPVQNVKVIHGKVVVAERKLHTENAQKTQTPSKTNSNFQNTIVIPIVVNPSTGQAQVQSQKPMNPNTFLQTLPNVGEESDNENSTPNMDLFTFTPFTTTTSTEPTTTTTTTTTTTEAPTTTTTTTTTTPTNTFVEITFKPTTNRPTTSTTRRPTTTKKPMKKPPKRKKPKPKPKPTRRPSGGSISLSLASLSVTPANDPGIEYVTSAPVSTNGINSLQISPLGYSSITGMTVVMKTLVGAMLVFLPSALVAAGIITSRRVLPLAKSDESIFSNDTRIRCEYNCLVQLVSDLTGSEPEFIKKFNNSTEMTDLTNSILDLFKNEKDQNYKKNR